MCTKNTARNTVGNTYKNTARYTARNTYKNTEKFKFKIERIGQMKSVKIENGLKFIRGFKTPEFESEFEISVILKEINDRPNLNLAIQCNKCDPEFVNTVFTINEDYFD